MLLQWLTVVAFLTVTLNQVNSCSLYNGCCPVPMDCPKFGCYDVLTLMFIVESGGQMSAGDFGNMLSFIEAIAYGTYDTSGSYKYGLVSFADTAVTHMGFDSDPSNIINAPQVGGNSVDFAEGIAQALYTLESVYSPIVCVFVASTTDSGSSSELAITSAALNNKCDRVMVIAITASVDAAQLDMIADPSNQFNPLALDSVITEINSMKVTLCVDPPPPDCLYKVDLALVIDTSSVSIADFPDMKNFLFSLVKATKLDLETIMWSLSGRSPWFNVAMTTFGGAKLNFNFTPSNKALGKILAAPKSTGAADFGAAIRFTNNKLLGSASDSNAPNVCLFMTSGTNQGKPAVLASAVTIFHMKCDRVIVIAVSSDIDDSELSLIAGDDDNKFSIKDFDDIVDAITDSAEAVYFKDPVKPGDCNIFHRADTVKSAVKDIYKTASDAVDPAIELCNELDALSKENLPAITADKVASLQAQVNTLKSQLKKGEAIIFKGVMKKIKKWIKKLKKLLDAIKEAIEKLWDGLSKKLLRLIKRLRRLFGKKFIKLIILLLKIAIAILEIISGSG